MRYVIKLHADMVACLDGRRARNDGEHFPRRPGTATDRCACGGSDGLGWLVGWTGTLSRRRHGTY